MPISERSKQLKLRALRHARQRKPTQRLIDEAPAPPKRASGVLRKLHRPATPSGTRVRDASRTKTSAKGKLSKTRTTTINSKSGTGAKNASETWNVSDFKHGVAETRPGRPAKRTSIVKQTLDQFEDGGSPVVMLRRVDEILADTDLFPPKQERKKKATPSKPKIGPKSKVKKSLSPSMSRQETLREVKKDMTDKWSELVSLMTKYEGYLRDFEGGKGKGATEADAIRLRVENEEMKIKIKVIENKWKSFKDEAIKNEVKLQRRIKQLENSNQRLKDAMEKMKTEAGKPKQAPKRKRVDPVLEEEEEDEEDMDDSVSESSVEKFGNVRVVSDPKRLRFHQDAIINGKRKRKPKFSHLQSEYAIDMKGMDKKMLDQDDDVAGVGSPDEGEGEDDDFFCPECEKTFDDEKTLRTHMKDSHGVLNPDAKFSCEKCNILLTSPVAYNRHMKYLHGQDEKPFFCDVCQVAFATQQNLQSHIDNKVHEKKGIVKSAGKGSDGKENPLSINVVKANSPNKPGSTKRNICPLCFMIFPTSMTMNEHMKKHKQNKQDESTTHACEYCEEVFFKKQALLDHEAKCPKNKLADAWDAIEFPDPSQVLEEHANYKDESLIDPELGPTADLQEAISANAGTEEPGIPIEGSDEKSETPAEMTDEAVPVAAEAAQYETVSIVDESGQPLGQAQVSVDPVTGQVTYVALGQNGEQLPLSQVLEGTDTSELLMSIINQANAAKDSAEAS